MRLQTFLLSCVLAVTALSAHAFDRPFPAHARRGVITMTNYPVVYINDIQRTLAVGVRIWNQNNTIDMPASLNLQEVVVNYTTNHQHEIDRVWILTTDEAAQPAPNQTPDPAASTTN